MLARSATRLGATGDSPRADSALLLGHVLGRGREWLLAHGETEVSAEEAHHFAALCERRAAGVPIAYLLGTGEFYGREFIVNERVLIPRPETEHLVDEALQFIGERKLSVLDVGTGCGAIACTIAAQSIAMVDATDSSKGAVEIARENARRLGVLDRCRFHLGNLADSVRSQRFDVVIANLPYIPTCDLPQAPDPASYEPREALDGGPEGLSLYRALLSSLPNLIDESAMVLFEAGPPTIEKVANLVSLALPNFAVSVGKDYAGLARYVKAIAPPSERLRTGEAASEAARSHGARSAGEAERGLAPDARAKRPQNRYVTSMERKAMVSQVTKRSMEN